MSRPGRIDGRRRIGLLLAGTAAVGLAALAGPASTALADPGPSLKLPDGTAVPCPDETYPAPGAARSSAAIPYQVPFIATLGQAGHGGTLSIHGPMVTATLFNIFAYGCGTINLPTQAGTLPAGGGTPRDRNFTRSFQFANPLSVSLSLTGIPSLPIPALSAYGASDGDLTAQILPAPATNGGLDVEFHGSAKSTSNFAPALQAILNPLTFVGAGVTVPPAIQSLISQFGSQLTSGAGAACTIAIGDLRAGGVPDLAATGLSLAQATTPLTLTTRTSGNLTGSPVIGPLSPPAGQLTAATATLVDATFPVAKIETATTPASGFPGTATCTAANAQLLDQLLGLPTVPGGNSYPNAFVAPGSFAVYTNGEKVALSNSG